MAAADIHLETPGSPSCPPSENARSDVYSVLRFLTEQVARQQAELVQVKHELASVRRQPEEFFDGAQDAKISNSFVSSNAAAAVPSAVPVRSIVGPTGACAATLPPLLPPPPPQETQRVSVSPKRQHPILVLPVRSSSSSELFLHSSSELTASQPNTKSVVSSRPVQEQKNTALNDALLSSTQFPTVDGASGGKLHASPVHNGDKIDLLFHTPCCSSPSAALSSFSSSDCWRQRPQLLNSFVGGDDKRLFPSAPSENSTRTGWSTSSSGSSNSPSSPCDMKEVDSSLVPDVQHFVASKKQDQAVESTSKVKELCWQNSNSNLSGSNRGNSYEFSGIPTTPQRRPLQRRTAGLPSGVWYDRVENRYVVQCNETTACGRKKRKYFGVARYGEEHARHYAVAARLSILGSVGRQSEESSVTSSDHENPSSDVASQTKTSENLAKSRAFLPTSQPTEVSVTLPPKAPQPIILVPTGSSAFMAGSRILHQPTESGLLGCKLNPDDKRPQPWVVLPPSLADASSPKNEALKKANHQTALQTTVSSLDSLMHLPNKKPKADAVTFHNLPPPESTEKEDVLDALVGKVEDFLNMQEKSTSRCQQMVSERETGFSPFSVDVVGSPNKSSVSATKDSALSSRQLFLTLAAMLFLGSASTDQQRSHEPGELSTSACSSNTTSHQEKEKSSYDALSRAVASILPATCSPSSGESPPTLLNDEQLPERKPVYPACSAYTATSSYSTGAHVSRLHDLEEPIPRLRGVNWLSHSNVWRARWVDENGREVSRCFSVDKFGWEGAKGQAIQARQEAERSGRAYRNGHPINACSSYQRKQFSSDAKRIKLNSTEGTISSPRECPPKNPGFPIEEPMLLPT